MARIRTTLSKKNKYYLSKSAFREAYYHALRYQEWKDRYNTLDGIKGIDYSADRVSSGVPGHPTESIAIQKEELSRKIKMIESLVSDVAPDIERYLLKAVTTEGITFEYLKQMMDIPCGKTYYYGKRRMFYAKLSAELDKKVR
ncbi:MAG: hypothetical protein ACOYBH_07900 [Candidatus Alectryocaccobium sp.]|jgi:hypothetical protein